MKAVINKGHHRTATWLLFLRLWLFGKQKITRTVTFYEDCLYDLPGEDDDLDVNKLFGLSEGYPHTECSARFGWLSNNGIPSILTYTYDKGVRNFEYIGNCKIGTPYVLTLWRFRHMWIFDSPAHMSLKEYQKSKRSWFVYYLGLYFGGNKPAPHRMTVDIKMGNKLW